MSAPWRESVVGFGLWRDLSKDTPAIEDSMRWPPKRFAMASEGQPHEGDREREERVVFPEEARGLDRGGEADDRVLLLADGPLAVRVHDRREDLVERDTDLEGLTERRLRGR